MVCESFCARGVKICLNAMLDQVGFQQSAHGRPPLAADGESQHPSHVPQRHEANGPCGGPGVLHHPGEGTAPVAAFHQALIALEPPEVNTATERNPRLVHEQLVKDG